MAEAEKSFIQLKQLLSQAAAHATADYKIPFHLDVSKGAHTVNGVLFQKKGGSRNILIYVSITLDMTETQQPPCTRHAAGVAKLI